MSDPISVVADGNYALNALSGVVARTEHALGALIALDQDGTNSLMTFDQDITPPAQRARLVLEADDAAIPADTTRICAGTVRISGQLQRVVAVRPK